MAMEEEEVSKQLDHMVKFIYREADEKASEIQAKAQEEFSIEKARIVQEEKIKLLKEFERKEKQIEVKKKIAQSNELNQSRLRVLKAREESVQKILAQAHLKLRDVTKDQNAYKDLLKKLIVQGLIKIDEPQVQVVCREEDKSLVKSVLHQAVGEYSSITGKTANVTLDENVHLPPGPEKAKNDAEFCSGGVVLSSQDGRIICSNTLDARLSMAFEQNLPVIREILFGKSLTRVHKD